MKTVKKLVMILSVISIIFMFNVQCFTSAGQSTLYANEYLVRGQYLISNNGQYTLSMQDDGNLVLYGRGRALWTTNTNGLSVSKCIMQGDGNLVIYGYPQTLWASNTAGWPGSYLVVQDDGNVVIYIGQKCIWATWTN